MTRDRFIDGVRVASILAVVVGHWLVTQFVWQDGTVQLQSALGAVPSLWPLTWVLQVIPLFFFVGGYGNLHSWEGMQQRGEGYEAFVGHRVSRLLGPTAVFLVAATLWAVVEGVSGKDVLGAGGSIMLQPLWFLGVYVMVIAATPLTVAWHRRWGWRVIAVSLLVVALTETIRLGFGHGSVAYVNVFVVWAMAHQLGYFYADSKLTRGRAAAMALGGLGVAGVLVAAGIYPARMVGVPGDQLVNMNPPTAALTALAIGQIGVTVLLRNRIDRWLHRPAVWAAVVAVNLAIMPIYLWHQVVLATVARIGLPLGLPQPPAGTVAWWASRPLWFAITGTLLFLIVVTARRFEPRVPTGATSSGRSTMIAAVTALVLLGCGTLVLAGTDPTRMLSVNRVLGVFDVAPVLGLACVLAAGWTVHAIRRGAHASGSALLTAAAGFLLIGLAYAVGLPPLTRSVGLTAVAAIVAAVLAVASGFALFCPTGTARRANRA